MAVNENDCKEIVDAVLKANVLLGVGHVMLYSPYTQKIKEIVQSGKIGKVISLQHLVIKKKMKIYWKPKTKQF